MTGMFYWPTFILSLLIVLLNSNKAESQSIILGQDTSRRVISHAVPFLIISPDAIGSAMGESGVAGSSRSSPIHWNVAGMSCMSDPYNISYSYTSWLPKVISDIELHYVSFSRQISSQQAIGGSLRYFDLGSIFFPVSRKSFDPQELALDLGYSRLLGESFSAGVAGRFIRSNISDNFSTSTIAKRIVNGYSFDLGFLYFKEIRVLKMKSKLSLGLLISNFGPGITYSDESNKDPLPTNLRVGSTLSLELSSNLSASLNLDFNKLLVPTPPIYQIDPGTGALVVDADGYPVIAKGKNPRRNLFSRTFGSFFDAPNGLPEELQEITVSAGFGLSYKEKITLRSGYFYEHELKGNRKYFTVGMGYSFNFLRVNFSYYIPKEINHLLSNTFRITVDLFS